MLTTEPTLVDQKEIEFFIRKSLFIALADNFLVDVALQKTEVQIMAFLN
jgi:hypothetical protein